MRSFIFPLNYAKAPPIPSGYPHRVLMHILMDKIYGNCYQFHSIVMQIFLSIFLFDWFGGRLWNCSQNIKLHASNKIHKYFMIITIEPC
jgi:hypothetical protein